MGFKAPSKFLSGTGDIFIMQSSFLMTVLVLAISAVSVMAMVQEFSICEAADSSILGTYKSEGEALMDGAKVYSNGNDMAFFRNKGFWYFGNLAPWPPETHYRCVEAETCNMNEDFPPTSAAGGWKASKKFGKEPVPVIVSGVCPTNEL